MKSYDDIMQIRRCALLILLIAALFCGCTYAQKKSAKPAGAKVVTKAGYKLYVNKVYHFQFEIPAEYKMVATGDGEDYNLEAITKADKKRFEDYDGIVFSLKVQKQSLEASVESDFEKGSDGEYYFRGVFNDSLKKATKITQAGFTGLKKVISCRVTSKERNGHTDSTVMEGCETVYLSNGKLTLCLRTDGIAIEDDDLNTIIQTLKFN